MGKEPEGVFLGAGKEPVIDRIFTLVERYPSRNAAARAWGVNVNTIKNYYRRQEDQPTPRPALLKKIAEHEGVSLEWLMNGEGEAPHSIPDKNTSPPIKTPIGVNVEPDGLYALLSILTDKERQSLYQAMVRKGVDTMLELIEELASLSPSELERVVRLAQQIREGASEADQENDLTDPTHRQAG
ncbi:MAG: hypothetical protein ACK5JN_02800 [Kluyvera sp.]|uniref:hypothetical protein n=1 Tax=Kluyvera sp. TaxID=1538228 RepID=UPI003A863636